MGKMLQDHANCLNRIAMAYFELLTSSLEIESEADVTPPEMATRGMKLQKTS